MGKLKHGVCQKTRPEKRPEAKQQGPWSTVKTSPGRSWKHLQFPKQDAGKFRFIFYKNNLSQ